MRRLLAAIAAVVMIAGGFLAYQARHDNANATDPATSDATGSEIASIWCVPEAQAACEQLPNVTATILSPAEIEARIVKAGKDPSALGVDAIVATKQWLDRWTPLSFDLKVDREAIAGTELVAVEKNGGLGCKGDLTCLLKAGSRLSIPDLRETSTGTIAAALSLQAEGATDLVDDLAPVVTSAASKVKRSLATPRTTIEALQALLAINLLDAVVMTRAEIESTSPANASVSPLSPAASVTVHIGVFGNADSTSLRTELRSQLLLGKWTANPAPDDLSSAYLNQTYKLLS